MSVIHITENQMLSCEIFDTWYNLESGEAPDLLMGILDDMETHNFQIPGEPADKARETTSIAILDKMLFFQLYDYPFHIAQIDSLVDQAYERILDKYEAGELIPNKDWSNIPALFATIMVTPEELDTLFAIKDMQSALNDISERSAEEK